MVASKPAGRRPSPVDSTPAYCGCAIAAPSIQPLLETIANDLMVELTLLQPPLVAK